MELDHSVSGTQNPIPAAIAIDEAFESILNHLADTDVFGRPDTPSVFFVYAHENDTEAPAYSKHVVQLLKWLRHIRSRTVSDQFPLPLWQTREGGDAALHNIVSNQLCLLPPRPDARELDSISSVDKVVLCGSPVLEQYCNDSLAQVHISDVTKRCEASIRHSNDNWPALLREEVERKCYTPGFHHVFTELAFLRVRCQENPAAGIIPLSLNGGDMRYVSFLRNTDLFLKLKSTSYRVELHRLFFKLLRTIYDNHHPYIDGFKKCYEDIQAILEARTIVSRVELGTITTREIIRTQEELIRHGNATLRNAEQKRRNQQNDVPTFERSNLAKILQTLASLPYEDRKDRNPKRVPGTCEWFLRHPLYQEWSLKDGSGILWVSADPGCGKSVLAKHLVDDVLLSSTDRTTCYFFFKDDFIDQKDVNSALRCILHQLFLQRPELLDSAIDEILSKNEQALKSFTILWDILLRIASNTSDEIVCILDALDECESKGQARLLDNLEDLFQQENNNRRLKFLITSRPYSHIARPMRSMERHCIRLSGEGEAELEQISHEISLVIGARMEGLAVRLQLTSQEQQILRTELTRDKHRTYLWVYLIFDVLNNMTGITEQDLQAKVRQLPQTVNEAYERILGRSRDARKARRLLEMIIAAERPLELSEMVEALAIEPDHRSFEDLELEPLDRFRTSVREICGLFVSIIHGKLYLLHQTAREFLLSKAPTRNAELKRSTQEMTWHHSLTLANAHLTAAEVCIRYLCLEGLYPVNSASIFTHGGEEVSDRGDNDSGGTTEAAISEDQPLRHANFQLVTATGLRKYAADSWTAHFCGAHGHLTDELIRKAMSLCEKRSDWLCLYVKDTYSPQYWHSLLRPLPILAFASYFGLEEIVQVILQKKVRWSDFKAVDYEHRRTALSIASANGHASIVMKILDFKPTRLRRTILMRNALQWVDPIDADDMTPLMHAASNGHEEVVRLLVAKGAKVNGPKGNHKSPLSYAIIAREEEIAKILLNHGANINPRNEESDVPLYDAILAQSDAIVQILLDRGANISVRGVFGEKPLHRAAYEGTEGTIRILLDHGANINDRNVRGDTPLHLAAGERFGLESADRVEAIIKLLLDHGADINDRNVRGETPLHMAAYWNREAAIKPLLDHGAAVNDRDESGETPLSIASRKHHRAIVRLLLQYGAVYGPNDGIELSLNHRGYPQDFE
ncbi:Serine/threonine-protein phosphatase 6 regulatory ankyrin repeat subunit A [Paramyrothecium foliicola]|nr:Serine/threonine-protein phosphatase 6 regulatory ankyrin repeat subunit A [Paramyrothecium foliicola]